MINMEESGKQKNQNIRGFKIRGINTRRINTKRFDIERMNIKWLNMRGLKDRKRRLKITVAAVVFAALIVHAGGETNTFSLERAAAKAEIGQECILSENVHAEQNITPQYAWWGTLYPKFCFSERKKGKRKISFWLAKAFDWC